MVHSVFIMLHDHLRNHLRTTAPSCGGEDDEGVDAADDRRGTECELCETEQGLGRIAVRGVRCSLRRVPGRVSGRVPGQGPVPRVPRPLHARRRGVLVCAGCGLVCTSSMNIVPEFREAPVVTARQRGKAKECSRSGDWLLAKTSSDAGSPVCRDEAGELPGLSQRAEHWNQFVAHPDYVLELARILRDWHDPGHSRLARVTAALLWPELHPLLPDADFMRQRVRTGMVLPVIRTTTPTARFACATCAARCFSDRDARFHCYRRRCMAVRAPVPSNDVEGVV